MTRTAARTIMTELTHVSLFPGIGNDDNNVSHKH